jgi:hypothetical protein
MRYWNAVAQEVLSYEVVAQQEGKQQSKEALENDQPFPSRPE